MSILEFVERVLTLAMYVPVSVTSWGRTETRNKAVGGNPVSHHLTWTGIDLVCDNQQLYKVRTEQLCRRLRLQLIDEGDHWHVEPI